ncbi:MAG: DALR domain-containing protein, partial [Saprospiraceae bacterium]
VLDSLYKEMNDDFNSPKALAILFDLVTRINSFKDGHTDIQQISPATLIRLQQEISRWVFDILGLRDDEAAEGGTDKLDGVMQLLIDIRQQSRAKKDYSVSDLMRDRLGKLKIVLKDSKEGTTWGNE